MRRSPKKYATKPQGFRGEKEFLLVLCGLEHNPEEAQHDEERVEEVQEWIQLSEEIKNRSDDVHVSALLL